MVADGQWESASLGRRIAASVHLMMCRHCRAFRRQMRVLARAASVLGGHYDAETDEEFESRITRRLVTSGPGEPSGGSTEST